MAELDDKMVNAPELSDRQHRIQTTLQPGLDIVVDDAELTDLTRMGVVVGDDAEDDVEEEEADNSTPAVTGDNSSPAPTGGKPNVSKAPLAPPETI